MNLLALDQSSRITGYSIWKDNQLIYYNTFKAKDNDIDKRLNFIRNTIKYLLVEYKIDYVIFEDIQCQKTINGAASINYINTFKVLSEVYGVISELLIDLEVPHETVLSSVWKSSFKISGKTRDIQKKNVQKWVNTTYNLDVTSDEADAICIGAYCIKEKSNSFDWS